MSISGPQLYFSFLCHPQCADFSIQVLSSYGGKWLLQLHTLVLIQDVFQDNVKKCEAFSRSFRKVPFMSFWADQDHSLNSGWMQMWENLASSPLLLFSWKWVHCLSRGIGWFLLGGQCVYLLKQGLDIIESKKDKYRVCAQLHLILFSVMNVVCLTSF